MRTARSEAAAFLLVLLAGCGGGGGGGVQASASSVVPPVAATPVAASVTTGPVTYLQSSGPLSSSGTIAGGTQQALVAVMSSAASSNSSYASDTLVVGTAATTQSVLARPQSAARSAAALPRSPVEAFAVDDRALFRGLAAFATHSSSPATRSTQSVLPSALSQGTVTPIWVQQGSLSATTRTNVRVPSTLLLQTAHGNIWIDNSLLSGANASTAFASASLQSTLAQIGTDFENAYASDVAHFASPDYGSNAPGLQAQYKSCSSSGASQGTTRGYVAEPADRRIDVLVVNSQNLGGLGGYFSASNLIPQSALNCLNGTGADYESNEAPFIFVGWFDRNGATYELQEDLVRSTAHELQHLVNFVNHGILASAAANASYNGNETQYVNEGLSMLAQDLAVENMYGARGMHFDVADALARAAVFLDAPGNFSITGFGGIDPGGWGGNGSAQYNCGGGCYGGAYLFQRYLRDRFGGDAYTRAMETSGVVGAQNLQTVTGQAPGALIDDFALAMAAGSLGVAPSENRFTFGSLQLKGTYADQFGHSTTLPGVYATPISGSAMQVQAPIGGFAFVSVGAVPTNGMPVQVTDRASVTGFGMTAGLAQH